MKSPDHPRPSGDRRIGRLLIKLLEKNGFQVELMSRLRAWEGQGDANVQLQIERKATEEARQLISSISARPSAERPDFWFTYHLYHKAPDWIGPLVAADLNIPYILAEASYAPKQASGPWSAGLRQVVRALQCASAIICLNPRDIPALQQLPARAKITKLTPFLDMEDIKAAEDTLKRDDIAERFNLDPDVPWIVCVAMMRDDAKLESYRYLAKSLDCLTQPFQLLVIGDGRARSKTEALFSAAISSRARFVGQLNQHDTLQALLAADIFAWPAVNEAIGMAILEAQACGLPVVVGNSGAIPKFVIDGKTGFICQTDDYQSIATHLDQLLKDETMRQTFSNQAHKNTRLFHSLPAAADQLGEILKQVR
jgi:glycosyltransferase involved in cell wall biosynthesis